MSVNPLNDISRVYLEQVAVSEALRSREERMARMITPAQRRRQARVRQGREVLADIQATERALNAPRTTSSTPQFDTPAAEVRKLKPGQKKDTLAMKAKKAMSEAKVDKKLPDYKRSAARTERYGNPYGSVGSGPQRDRRADHEVRRGIKKEALDPVGREDADIDNDGDTDKSDKYLHNRRKAVGKAIAKKKGMKEGFSNWRQELAEVVEVIDKSKKDQKITEKQVNNKVVINPTLNLGDGVRESVEKFGGTLLEMVELDEEFIYETVSIATEYFYEMGLNEVGVNILIEELGLEGFVDFVFQLSEEYTLNEARRSGRIEPVTAKGTAFKSGKPTGKSLQRLRDQKAARRDAESKASASKPSGMKAALQRQSAVASAKKQQPAKKPLKDRIAKGVLDAVKAYQSGMERHRAATATAGKALKVAGRGASEFGRGVASGVRTVGKVARDVRKVVGEESQLNEKSESEQQQKLFGLALSVKRGDTSRSEVSDAVLKIVDTMSEKKIRDFAKTKHEGIPKKVEANEDLQPTTPQQFAAQRQLAMAQRKLTAADQIALQQKKKMMPGTVQKENTSDAALELVRQSIMKKHGAASLIGTPENKAAQKAAAEKAKTQSKPKQREPYPDDVYSRGIGIRGYRSGD